MYCDLTTDKRFAEPNPLFTQLTADNIETFTPDQRFQRTLRNTLTSTAKAGWTIFVHWQKKRFVIVDNATQTISQDDLPFTRNAMHIVGQCALLATPPSTPDATTDTVSATSAE